MEFSPQPKHIRGATLAAAAVFAALLASCASPGLPPTAALATARNSIAKAESASALESAPLELRAARDKLAMAEAAARDEQFVRARRLAEQAEADAELSERKARAIKAQSTALELARGNEALRQEAERKARP